MTRKKQFDLFFEWYTALTPQQKLEHYQTQSHTKILHYTEKVKQLPGVKANIAYWAQRNMV